MASGSGGSKPTASGTPTKLPQFLPPFLRAEIDRRVGFKYHLEYRMEGVPANSPDLTSRLKPLFRRHYPTPDRYARWLAEMGAYGAAKLVRELLPTKDTVQAGELGEIFLTDFIENVLRIPVPVLKLRHKDGRNVPLRGVDSLGVLLDDDDKLIFVKGESKVAEYLTTAVVDEAREQLESMHGGIPPHSVLFVVNHEDAGNKELQRQCESYVDKRRRAVIRHVLFAAHNRIVGGVLGDFLDKANVKRRTYAVGLKIEDYDSFIPAVFRVAGEP